MEITSLAFLYVFLPVCLIAYYFAKGITARNVVLIGFSLLFYAWERPIGILFILINALVNYILGFAIEIYKDKHGGKVALIISLIINLGMLAVFKYSGFFIENVNLIASSSLKVPNLIAPLGISYYTFRSISYMIDCYWGKVAQQKSFTKYLLYTCFFAHIIAGPIVRYSTVENDLSSRHVVLSDFNEAATRIVWGIAKKVIIANNLYTIVQDMFIGSDVPVTISKLTVLGTWYGVLAFSLYMYFDFSGYSDIVIGIARLFGFHFDENFNYPFMCKTIAEFWQRWHISLGTFFRDYMLCISFGGKRLPYLNLFLIWFCTGLWHGASWNYIIWGLYFGIWLFIEQLITKKRLKKVPKPILHIYSKLIIVVGFGIFFFTNFSQLGDFFKNLVGLNGNALADEFLKSSLLNNMFLILAAILFCFPLPKLIDKYTAKSESLVAAKNVTIGILNAVLIIVSTVMMANATSNPFFYGNF